jgi:hypothetical protein
LCTWNSAAHTTIAYASPRKPKSSPGPTWSIEQLQSDGSGHFVQDALNSASWFPPGCAGGFACNVVALTITGTSSTPFNYDETYVTAWYGGTDQPWTHPNQTERLGASSAVNYQRINKLPPLRTGSVASGQTTHGFAGFDLQGQGDLYVEVGGKVTPDHPV